MALSLMLGKSGLTSEKIETHRPTAIWWRSMQSDRVPAERRDTRRGVPSDSAPLASLKTLFETKRGQVLPLPPKLTRLYGCLRMPLPRSHPHVFSNFVTTLDGVVSLNAKGHASGADISGFNTQDRMVMGLLRAIADAVIIGSGTLRADRRHVWTAEAICPELADEYRRLGSAGQARGAAERDRQRQRGSIYACRCSHPVRYRR